MSGLLGWLSRANTQDRVKKAEKISAEQKPSKASITGKRKLKRKTGVAPAAKKTPTRKKADASGDSSAGSSASASSPAAPRSKSPKSKATGVKTASIKKRPKKPQVKSNLGDDDDAFIVEDTPDKSQQKKPRSKLKLTKKSNRVEAADDDEDDASVEEPKKRKRLRKSAVIIDSSDDEDESSDDEPLIASKPPPAPVAKSKPRKKLSKKSHENSSPGNKSSKSSEVSDEEEAEFAPLKSKKVPKAKGKSPEAAKPKQQQRKRLKRKEVVMMSDSDSDEEPVDSAPVQPAFELEAKRKSPAKAQKRGVNPLSKNRVTPKKAARREFVSVEDFFGDRTVSDPKMNPDGKKREEDAKDFAAPMEDSDSDDDIKEVKKPKSSKGSDSKSSIVRKSPSLSKRKHSELSAAPPEQSKSLKSPAPTAKAPPTKKARITPSPKPKPAVQKPMTPTPSKASAAAASAAKAKAKKSGPELTRNASKFIPQEAKASASSSSASDAPAPRRWYPGMQRAAPPKAGQTQLPTGKPWCLANMRFVITGVLESLEREEAKELIETYGGRVTGSVSGMTSYLVAGTEPGQSKIAKAKDKQVTVIDEAGLFNLIRTEKEKKAPKGAVARKPVKAASISVNTSALARAPHPSASSGGARSSASSSVSSSVKKGAIGGLWVDKYKPVKITDLVGNQSMVMQMKRFLQNWPPKKGAYAKRALLLSGPPGIGKTTAAHIIAKESGWEILEMNASDTRSRKSLHDKVRYALGFQSLSKMFGAQVQKNSKQEMTAKTVVIMDEVDGMGGGDRGGMKELIGLIKNTKVPMICICNDRQSQKIRSLVNHCIDLKFRRPTPNQLMPRLMGIARLEGMNLSQETILKIAESVHYDLRQMLNMMQYWSSNERQGADTAKGVKERLASSKKDFDVGMWDAVPRLFIPPRTPEEKKMFITNGINIHFVDASMVPLMVQENYLRSRASMRYRTMQEQVDALETAAEAAHFVADGDIVSNALRSRNDWSLATSHAVMSTLAPAYIMSGQTFCQFPSWLGKNSNRNKNYRLTSELRTHMNLVVSGSVQAMSMDYLPALRRRVTQPLVADGKEGITSVLTTMHDYGLTRDDWDTVSSLVGLFGKKPVAIPTTVRSAFTRRYNQEVHINHKSMAPKRAAAAASTSSATRDEDGEIIDDDTQQDDEDEESDVGDDNLIVDKNKKKKAAKGGTKGKRGARGGGAKRGGRGRGGKQRASTSSSSSSSSKKKSRR